MKSTDWTDTAFMLMCCAFPVAILFALMVAVVIELATL